MHHANAISGFAPFATVTIHSFQGAAPPHMMGTTWQHRLDAAHGVDEVVAATRDFLANLGPLELAALPEECRPPAKIFDADDVSSYAFELVRFECAERDDTAELVHKLARFFSHASMRVAQLTARNAVADDDARRSA
jgi:hypothetical protein